jgi:hypothetical protein
MSTSCRWTCGQSKLSLSLDCIRHTIFINGKGIILLVDKYNNNKLIKMKYKGAPLPIATIASRAHGVCASWVLLECLAGVMHRGRGCGVQGVCGHTPGSGFALQFGAGGATLCWGALWWLLCGGAQLWCPGFVVEVVSGSLGGCHITWWGGFVCIGGCCYMGGPEPLGEQLCLRILSHHQPRLVVCWAQKGWVSG